MVPAIWRLTSEASNRRRAQHAQFRQKALPTLPDWPIKKPGHQTGLFLNRNRYSHPAGALPARRVTQLLAANLIEANAYSCAYLRLDAVLAAAFTFSAAELATLFRLASAMSNACLAILAALS